MTRIQYQKALFNLLTDLIEHEVEHSTFGIGTIKNVDKDFVTIDFSGVKKRMFMDHFFKNHNLLDANDKYEEITNEFKESEKERKELEKLEIQKQNEKKEIKRKQKEEMYKADKELGNHVYLKNKRSEGKSAVFLVCQKNNFDIESAGGYLWAPSDTNRSSHKEMKYVIQGDIIVHHFANTVYAISVVTQDCYVGDIDNRGEGYIVLADYLILDNPTNTTKFKNEKIQYGNFKYGPFNKLGNNKEGVYLTELGDELGLIFIDEAILNNPFKDELKDVRSLI